MWAVSSHPIQRRISVNRSCRADSSAGRPASRFAGQPPVDYQHLCQRNCSWADTATHPCYIWLKRCRLQRVPSLQVIMGHGVSDTSASGIIVAFSKGEQPDAKGKSWCLYQSVKVRRSSHTCGSSHRTRDAWWCALYHEAENAALLTI